MKRIKNYTAIWNVEHVQYALGDLKLPFPLTYSQMGWLVGTFCFVLAFGNVPPLSWTDNLLIKYAAIPIGVTWFMSKKTFDGKRPYCFIRSVLSYAFRPKRTYAGKKVVYRKQKADEAITIVRREIYVPN